MLEFFSIHTQALSLGAGLESPFRGIRPVLHHLLLPGTCEDYLIRKKGLSRLNNIKKTEIRRLSSLALNSLMSVLITER